MNLKEAFPGVEDDKRVFGNDPMKSFVPIEEVPDTSVDIEEDVDEKIGKVEEEIEIGFKEGEGVAHVGPDFDKVDDKSPIKIEKAEEEPTAESLKKNYRLKSFDKFKPSVQSNHWPALGHDNLKTLKKKPSFLGRLFRGKTRDILENPEIINQENRQDILDVITEKPDLDDDMYKIKE